MNTAYLVVGQEYVLPSGRKAVCTHVHTSTDEITLKYTDGDMSKVGFTHAFAVRELGIEVTVQ